jgi:hypothetical protein
MLRAFVLAAALWGAASAALAQSDADPLQAAMEAQRLLADFLKLPAAATGDELTQIDQWRSTMEGRLTPIIDGLTRLADRPDASADVAFVLSLAHARRAGIWLDRRRELDREYADAEARLGPDSTAKPDAALALRRAQLAEQTAGEYRKVEETLRAALRKAEELAQRRELKLTLGVVFAQSAIVEDRAVDAADDAGIASKLDATRLSSLLDESRRHLDEYLARTDRSTGLEWVRGQIYLGVVQYRRSLKPRVPGEKYATTLGEGAESRAAFDAAVAIFSQLDDSAETLAILRPEGAAADAARRAYESSSLKVNSGYSIEAVAGFYAAVANMYLGLLSAIDPRYAADGQGRLDAARGYLDRAVTFDKTAPAAGEAAISLSSGTIPLSRDKIVADLERAATQTVAERRPLNDFVVSWGLGGAYDSNVILLGRNTEAPLDKRRKRDFRGSALTRFSYVADLDTFAPGDEFLKKWQVFLEARASSTWNVRIHDFNEQNYGGTVNLRYELLGPGAIEGLDALYAHLRYDYDYILLGNDGFLRINRLRPSLEMVAFESLLDVSVYFSYEDRNYLEVLGDERFDRDGNYLAGGIDTRVNLGQWISGEKLWGKDNWAIAGPREDDKGAFERPMELQIGLEFTSNSTQGDEFDYSSAILGAGVLFPLPWGVNLSARATYEWQDYWQASRVDRSRRVRDEFIQEYGVRLERPFFLTNYEPDFEHALPQRLQRLVATVYGDIRFTFDDSNVRDRLGQSVFEYNRAVYGFGVRFDLN